MANCFDFMKHYKSLSGLTISLTFWIILVLTLLSANSGPGKRTTATRKKPVMIAAATAAAPSPARPVPAVISERPPSKPLYKEIKGKLRQDESFETALKRLHVSGKVRTEIIKAFSSCLDYKCLRAGDHFSIILNKDNALIDATYESDPLNIYRVNKTDNGFAGDKLPIPLVRRVVKLNGVIKSSLFAAFLESGENDRLAQAFADIFSSKFDFNTEPRKNDRFSLIVEKYYKDGKFVCYGKILMGRYEPLDNNIMAGFYYAPEHGPGAYFNRRGEELRTSFLRSPLPLARVTSRFTLHRRHPIFGGIRPHLGVDLAAPTGTPVMAACDGKVKFMGRNGGFGNQVILSHNGGYHSHYAHLSRFKKGLHVGSRIKQKDIIGYVGATGYATGPHLDYRIDINGVFKNPFSLKFKPRSVLNGVELEKFSQVMTKHETLMDLEDNNPVLSENNITLRPEDNISTM